MQNVLLVRAVWSDQQLVLTLALYEWLSAPLESVAHSGQ
jgi:hypothetical protein